MSRGRFLPILCGLCAALPLRAADAPLDPAEYLVQKMPAGFKVGFRNVRDGMTMMEMVPEHESVENWTRMVTTQVFKGRGDWRPGAFLGALGEGFAAACPNLTHTDIVNGNANGYPTSVLAVQCPNNPATNKPENVYFRAIQGKDSFYAVQVAYRFPVGDAEKKFIEDYFRSIIACDTRSAEHPCPDLAAQGFKPQ